MLYSLVTHVVCLEIVFDTLFSWCPTIFLPLNGQHGDTWLTRHTDIDIVSRSEIVTKFAKDNEKTTNRQEVYRQEVRVHNI